MILDVRSNTWRRIYDIVAYEIFDKPGMSLDQHEIKEILWERYNILLIIDADGRWDKAYIDENDVTMYLLKSEQ